ncbi:hypothetical protein [Kribbella sp. NPDC051620]|uniref:hypothetical protein n=1 Tax=Kribbella sp. NPDC051620 TaxID=3364120 RepID=UPI003799337D
MVAGAFAELARDTSAVTHQLDEFLEFVGGVDWRTLYTGSVIVVLEMMLVDGSVHVHAHRGEQRGDVFVRQPIEPWTTAYLDSPADLGATVLAALHRSSTTGWSGPYPD